MLPVEFNKKMDTMYPVEDLITGYFIYKSKVPKVKVSLAQRRRLRRVMLHLLLEKDRIPQL